MTFHHQKRKTAFESLIYLQNCLFFVSLLFIWEIANPYFIFLLRVCALQWNRSITIRSLPMAMMKPFFFFFFLGSLGFLLIFVPSQKWDADSLESWPSSDAEGCLGNTRFSSEEKAGHIQTGNDKVRSNDIFIYESEYKMLIHFTAPFIIKY